MWRSVLIGVALSLALPCAAAFAGTVRFDRSGVLVYRAAPGERNNVRVAIFEQESTGAHHFVDFEVKDSVPITPGNGCERARRGRPYFVRCSIDLPYNVHVALKLGDGDDRSTAAGQPGQSVVVDGGPGNDTLSGGAEADGLEGGPGADVLAGGAGDDSLVADSLGDYATDYPPTLRLGGTSRRPGDRLFGGAGDDRLIGSAGANLLAGGADADYVLAGPGRDRILDRDGRVDYVSCESGRDVARNDEFDFLSSCERHSPLSTADAVPIALDAEGTFAGNWTKVLVGCRPSAAARCVGTVRAELGGAPLSPDVSFETERKAFVTVDLTLFERLGPWDYTRDDFVIAINSGRTVVRTEVPRIRFSWSWWE